MKSDEHPEVRTYADLVVWQRSMELVESIYRLAGQFPSPELYGLTAQMKRAAVSIPSNIAEGSRRGTRADFRHFLLNAYGSGAELETQLALAGRLSFGQSEDRTRVAGLLDEVMRMLNRFIENLKE